MYRTENDRRRFTTKPLRDKAESRDSACCSWRLRALVERSQRALFRRCPGRLGRCPRDSSVRWRIALPLGGIRLEVEETVDIKTGGKNMKRLRSLCMKPIL